MTMEAADEERERADRATAVPAAVVQDDDRPVADVLGHRAGDVPRVLTRGVVTRGDVPVDRDHPGGAGLAHQAGAHGAVRRAEQARFKAGLVVDEEARLAQLEPGEGTAPRE